MQGANSCASRSAGSSRLGTFFPIVSARSSFLCSASSFHPAFLSSLHSLVPPRPRTTTAFLSELSSRRQLYATSAASDRLTVPELTRSLVESRKSGSLTTVQLFAGHKKEGGSLPLYGSLMPYILDIEAVPIVGLRPDEKHVKNLEQVDLASLVVYPLTPVNINPSNFALPRVNLAGRLRKLDPAKPSDSIVSVRRQYLLTHPGCAKIIDDLSFYKLEIEDTVYCSGGLQETTHVPFAQYKAAQVDTVMQGSRPILDWMNGPKRAIYLKLFCKEYAQMTDVGEIFMFAVDRKGFEVMAWRQSNRTWTELRFPFPYEMKSVDDCKGGLLDSCSYLHDKYLKDIEGSEKFDVEGEKKQEQERMKQQEEEESARRRAMSEPEW